MKSLKIFSIMCFALSFFSLARANDSNEAQAKATLKVLAVGNSFSINATRYLPSISEAGDKDLLVRTAFISGGSLANHVRALEAHEADPTALKGRPYNKKGVNEAGEKIELWRKSLKEMLREETWDIVTIQQASPSSFKPETYQPTANRLMAYIREHAPQAEIVVHQTWAYREDHKFWGREGLNADVMYSGIRKAYDQLAADAKLRLIPCGDAMEAARRDPAWGPFMAGDPPAARPEKSLHSSDGYHASPKGQFLQGCVWYEFLFKDSVLGNTFKPRYFTDEEAATLRRIAHEVVTEGKRPEPK